MHTPVLCLTVAFQTIHSSFEIILGEKPSIRCLLEEDEALFHEAAVFIPQLDELFVTSKRLVCGGDQRVEISRISLGLNAESATRHGLQSAIVMGNGAVNYRDGVIFCDQGNWDAPSGLHFMSLQEPHDTELLVAGFGRRPFNSVNDVVVDEAGGIWFTDPAYGYEQGYRPEPVLLSQVYRFEPQDDSIRAMADGFDHPNELCFSPDGKILYVTDTARVRGDGTTDGTKPSSIYAFDVRTIANEPCLCNRRLFAMAEVGIPDGIKCDMAGNVYSGCGDGVNVWNSGGVLLGKILVKGGVANFCFARNGQMFLLNETRLWEVRLATSVYGALLGM